MPKDSCVAHHDGFYLEVRRDYINLFDGDRCAAVLMGFFEFATNGELARMRLSGEDGEPWIRASMSSIYEETLGIYSIRLLQDKLDWIEMCGLVKHEEGPRNIARRYLLNFALLTEYLKSRKVLNDTPSDRQNCRSGKIAGPAELPTKLPITGGVLNLKEESLITDNTPYSPSLEETQENLYPEDPIDSFTKGLYRRHGRGKPKFTDRFGNDLKEALRFEEAKRGSTPVRQALVDYVRRDDDWVKVNKWPLYAALVIIRKLPTVTRPPEPSPASVLPVRGGAAPPTSANAPAAPYNASKREIVFVEQLPELAVKWNQIVKHGEPVKVWSKGSRDHKNLQSCMEEDEFVRNQEEILEKTEQILAEAVEDNAWFVNFGWLFKEGNWTKVLNGNYRWVKNGGVEKRSKHKSAADQLIEELEQKIQKGK